MKKILIFGIGLIGGSIALKVKQKKLFDQIIGVGRSGGTSLSPYVSSGMLDITTENPSKEIASANLIVIATPVAQTKKILADIYPFLNKKTVVTDVGSTKSDVMDAAKESLKEKFNQFIGSHPIAGSEKHGPSSANFNLFENKDIIITPHDTSVNSSIDYLRSFWVELGGRVSQMTPAIHDEIFSTVSHVPHLLAFGLVNSSKFGVKMILSKAFSLLLIVTIFWTILQSVEYLGARLKFRAEQTESKVDDQLIPFAIEIVKVLVVIFAIVFILANVFDQNVTALAAGLGVGGVAVALASKESLENLLGSFTIFLDKPFQVGDIITLGSTTGLVEKVGFRSTRLRTFDKSIVTVPNKNLVNAELDNLGLRPVRRVKTNIGLIYSTPIEQIKNIVNDIQELIDDHKQTTQDGKVRFLNFGDSSLDVMVLYFVNSPDWNILVDTQQEINFKIIEIVKKHQSDFAYPTTSVFLENQKS